MTVSENTFAKLGCCLVVHLSRRKCSIQVALNFFGSAHVSLLVAERHSCKLC